MKILVACEFSGKVRDAFTARGHDSWSADLIESETPGNHIICDHDLHLLDVLKDGWDLMVAHPPCTRLAVSGARWFKIFQEEQENALSFVRALLNAPIYQIALENPVSIISSRIRKPDQTIQPWEFGHPESKRTCLWLKNLPLLRSTNLLLPRNGDWRRGWDNQTPSGQNKLGPSPTRAKERSRTYEGIAKAMAEQWGAGTNPAPENEPK